MKSEIQPTSVDFQLTDYETISLKYTWTELDGSLTTATSVRNIIWHQEAEQDQSLDKYQVVDDNLGAGLTTATYVSPPPSPLSPLVNGSIQAAPSSSAMVNGGQGPDNWAWQNQQIVHATNLLMDITPLPKAVAIAASAILDHCASDIDEMISEQNWLINYTILSTWTASPPYGDCEQVDFSASCPGATTADKVAGALANPSEYYWKIDYRPRTLLWPVIMDDYSQDGYDGQETLMRSLAYTPPNATAIYMHLMYITDMPGQGTGGSWGCAAHGPRPSSRPWR